MRWLLPPFLALALVGLVLSLTAHVAALFGRPLSPGVWPWIGLLVVWPSAVVVMRRHGHDGKSKDPQEASRACPPWMERLANGIGLYAAVDFAIVFVWHASGLDQRQGNQRPAGPPENRKEAVNRLLDEVAPWTRSVPIRIPAHLE